MSGWAASFIPAVIHPCSEIYHFRGWNPQGTPLASLVTLFFAIAWSRFAAYVLHFRRFCSNFSIQAINNFILITRPLYCSFYLLPVAVVYILFIHVSKPSQSDQRVAFVGTAAQPWSSVTPMQFRCGSDTYWQASLSSWQVLVRLNQLGLT